MNSRVAWGHLKHSLFLRIKSTKILPMLHSKICRPVGCNAFLTRASCCLHSSDNSAYLVRRESPRAQKYPRTIGRLRCLGISKRRRPLQTASFLQRTVLFWRQGPPKETQATSARRLTLTHTHTIKLTDTQHLRTRTHRGSHAIEKTKFI